MNKHSLPHLFRFGIRVKVIFVLVTVLLTALSISGWMVFNEQQKRMLNEINQRGQDTSRFVAKSLAYSVIGYDYHSIQFLLDEALASDQIRYARVISRNGNTMAEAGYLGSPNQNDVVIFVEDIMFDNDSVGQLILGYSTLETQRRLEQQKETIIQREVLIILLIAVGEFLALSILIIRPMTIMTQALRDNLDARGQIRGEIPVISNDEFGDLAQQFNHLKQELNTANERLQAKIDFADEELRLKNHLLLEQSEELQRINEEFRQMSITDALTGMYNRRYFEDVLEAEIAMTMRHGDKNSLVVIDIDHFKRVNDTYGHSAGDMVLKEIAHILKRNMRKTDILFRIGGEEFVVLCKRTSKADAINIAEQLRVAVEKREFELDNLTVSLTISVGIATIPGNNGTDSAEDFYRCADVALYFSKNSGRNRVTHYEDSLPNSKNQLHINTKTPDGINQSES